MSTDATTPEARQMRMKEFMQLLPLTIELAGLPTCDPNRSFTTDQMEARATSLRSAYKVARALIREIGETGQ
ncbi:MAG: hypothetical protein LC104_20195 [Bacteroidales bacterium]|nr:hypothetical protein [Bacteroidales bacterium]